MVFVVMLKTGVCQFGYSMSSVLLKVCLGVVWVLRWIGVCGLIIVVSHCCRGLCVRACVCVCVCACVCVCVCVCVSV